MDDEEIINAVNLGLGNGQLYNDPDLYARNQNGVSRAKYGVEQPQSEIGKFFDALRNRIDTETKAEQIKDDDRTK